jgi:hypothetical protein
VRDRDVNRDHPRARVPSTIANVSGTAREKSRRTICDFFPKTRKRFCGTRKAKGVFLDRIMGDRERVE